VIVLLAYLVISSFGEVITKSYFEYFDLNKEDILPWLILGLISILVLVFVVLISGIEIHDFFGISETVDIQLTGTTERIRNGKVKHVQYRK
jgi:hypothetical protein